MAASTTTAAAATTTASAATTTEPAATTMAAVPRILETAVNKQMIFAAEQRRKLCPVPLLSPM